MVTALPGSAVVPQESRMTPATPLVLSPWRVQKAIVTLERENWLIFIELWLSTACTIIIRGESFEQTDMHMVCCTSSFAPAVK